MALKAFIKKLFRMKKHIEIPYYGIMVIRKALDTNTCDKLIEFSKTELKWEEARTLIQIQENTSDREHGIRRADIARMAFGCKYDKVLEDVFWSSVKEEYFLEHPNLSINKDQGYEIIKYGKGDGYGVHVDNADYSTANRIITGILYLSEDYMGGELVFPQQDFSIKPNKGDLVIFPANFLYPHKCEDILEGEKYISVCFFLV
jgi:hypothetical protein